VDIEKGIWPSALSHTLEGKFETQFLMENNSSGQAYKKNL